MTTDASTPTSGSSPTMRATARQTPRPWTPVRVALTVLVLATAFVGARLLAHGGDPTAFVRAGDEFTQASGAPDLTIEQDDAGYDGQYFHRLARNPFTRSPREFGTIFDRPAYRQARIAYPLVVWAVTGGGRVGVPWALIGVNLAAMGVLALLAAQLAVEGGRPATWGLLAAGWPGLVVALSYDLSEVLAGTLLLATLLALRHRNWVGATALLAVAGLTRETTLVLAAAIVGGWMLGLLPRPGRLASFARHPDGVPVLVGVVPIAVAAGYRLLLDARWAGVPETGADIPSFVGIPFRALLAQIGTWLTHGDVVGWYQLFQVILLVGVVVTFGRLLLDQQAGLPHERLALLGTLLIMSMLPAWDRNVVFLRWADETVLLGLAVSLGARRFPIRPVAEAVAALSITTVLVWISI